MGRAARSLATVFFALVLAGVAVLAAGWSPGEAEAQGTGTVTGPVVEELRLSREEWRIVDNSSFRTASPDQAEASRARRVWSRSWASPGKTGTLK